MQFECESSLRMTVHHSTDRVVTWNVEVELEAICIPSPPHLRPPTSKANLVSHFLYNILLSK